MLRYTARIGTPIGAEEAESADKSGEVDTEMFGIV
jgi:hypothetical protein